MFMNNSKLLQKGTDLNLPLNFRKHNQLISLSKLIYFYELLNLIFCPTYFRLLNNTKDKQTDKNGKADKKIHYRYILDKKGHITIYT